MVRLHNESRGRRWMQVKDTRSAQCSKRDLFCSGRLLADDVMLMQWHVPTTYNSTLCYPLQFSLERVYNFF